MSLKNMHIAFVVAAIGLALFCGVRGLETFLAEARPSGAVACAASVVVAATLAWYEAGFIRRCRKAGIR